MPFPKVNRVLYNKSPLQQVICQFRFPAILKIDSEIPSAFQEMIRNHFPLYHENIEVIQEFPKIIGSNFSQQLNQEIKKPLTNKNHNFSTADGTWQVNLTRTFLSLSTSKYTRWEEFNEKLLIPIKALSETYHPPFFTRLGLRYIDVFDRSKLGIPKVPWSELLNPHFLGLLSSAIDDEIIGCEGKYEINLEDKESILRLVTTFVKTIETNEMCYLVDSDFYYPKKIEIDNYPGRLEFLHDQAERLIRFIITDRLHDAMKPSDLK